MRSPSGKESVDETNIKFMKKLDTIYSHMIYRQSDSDGIYYRTLLESSDTQKYVIVIDLFSETVSFNHRGGRSRVELKDQ